MGASLLPIIAAASLVPAAATVPLAGVTVRVRDAAVSASGADLAILTLRETPAVTLTPAELRRLVANRLPGVRFVLLRASAVRFVRAPAPRRAGTCLQARSDLPAGTQLNAEMVAPAPCAGTAANAALGYDRAAHVPFARRDIAAGTRLGRFRLGAGPVARTGQDLTLRTAIGPVVIERKVVALQSARAGSRVFVRTDDGAVVSSRVATAGEERR